jgi:hypothetical protein
MLYLGDGAKNNGTSISSYDPMILRFVLYVLINNYGVTLDNLKCELHLRMHYNEDELCLYRSKELNLPIDQFGYTAYDKRSARKATYAHYEGVCVLRCKNIAIQRKLISLYNLFCEKVDGLTVGD